MVDTAHDEPAMPSRIPMAEISLGDRLLPRPDAAAVAPEEAKAAAQTLTLDSTYGPDSGVTDTDVKYHGGAVASGVLVELIFWGLWWTTTDGVNRRQRLVSEAMNLIEGPYFSALGQYGLQGPRLRGATTVWAPEPPPTFDDASVGDLVWAAIEQGNYPHPDQPGGRIAYCVYLPPGTRYAGGDQYGGAHGNPSQYFFPPLPTAWVAWISYKETMSRTLGHELAELVTDPEGTGWWTDANQEIADLCQASASLNKGVVVAGYWARQSKACIVPQCVEVVSGVSRNPGYIDVFTVGADGGIYTAFAGPEWPDGWQGWESINGGLAAPGSSVYAVSCRPGRLDVFAVGTDMGVYWAFWQPDFTDGWQGWSRIGDLTVGAGSSVYAVSCFNSAIDIFAVGSDSGIFTTGLDTNEGTWHTWRRLSGGMAAPGTTVFAVSRGALLIDVFAIGTDLKVYTASRAENFFSNWSSWQSINDGSVAPGTSAYPVCRSQTSGLIDVFIVGSDHGVWTAWLDPNDANGWQGWVPLNDGVVAPGTSVFGVSARDDHVSVFAVGTDHVIYTAFLQPEYDGWQGWIPVVAGGRAAPGTSVFPISMSQDRIDIFAIGTDAKIYNAAYEPDFPSWEGWWPLNDGVAAWGI